MLDYEMNLFTCLGWNEAMWESSDQNPQIWDASWEDIGPERRVCATACGYDRSRWNVSLFCLEKIDRAMTLLPGISAVLFLRENTII